MVDSEQVLGCKAPMGLVLVLLLSSLLGPLGQAQGKQRIYLSKSVTLWTQLRRSRG